MKLLTLVLFIELHVAEVEKHIDGDFDEVQAIEDPAQNEDRAALANDKELDALHHNAGDVAEPDEDLKLQALALSGSGLYRFVNGKRPGKTECKNHYGFQYFMTRWKGI